MNFLTYHIKVKKNKKVVTGRGWLKGSFDMLITFESQKLNF